MAKLECELTGDFDEVLSELDRKILSPRVTGSLEDSSDFGLAGSRCAVRVYERYSIIGSNRLSMSITLYEASGRLFLSAITAGGSQGVIFKINTFGETAFLDTIRPIVDKFML